jgi:hypothetical protein
VVVTSAVCTAIGPSPTEVALALVFGCFATVAVDALLVAGLGAVLFAVAVKAALALAAITAVGVGAHGIRVAIVEPEIALVDVGTLGVGPTGIVSLQRTILVFAYYLKRPIVFITHVSLKR